MAEKPAYFQWQPSSYFGWGVYGLNLMLHTARRSDMQAVSTYGVNSSDLALTPLERLSVRESIQASNQIADQLRGFGSGTLHIQGTVLHALGIDMAVACASAGDVTVESAEMVGVVFAENTRFSEAGRDRAARYVRLVAGSTWQQRMLQANGVSNVETVLQGVDVTNFHPAPKSGLLEDRFVVFSGGKLEYRKGQDIVVRAFAAFAQSHPDALLVTAWSSPFPQLATTLNRSSGLIPIQVADGAIDALAWTTANGISPAQVIHLGAVANAEMPRILREADVALFPNRAEAGTNLVAMEAMACGVPCMLSMNTGHLDIIGDGAHCLALGTQTAIQDDDCDGWGESDLDEIVAVLEAVHARREAARVIGEAGATAIGALTWSNQIDKLMAVVAGIEPATLQSQRVA